ncbi:MAG: hypothetical protein R2699_06215 [Acidimicrobiales bacterium]
MAIYQDLRPLLGDLALHRRPYGVGPAAGALRHCRTSLRKVPVRAQPASTGGAGRCRPSPTTTRRARLAG